MRANPEGEVDEEGLNDRGAPFVEGDRLDGVVDVGAGVAAGFEGGGESCQEGISSACQVMLRLLVISRVWVARSLRRSLRSVLASQAVWKILRVVLASSWASLLEGVRSLMS